MTSHKTGEDMKGMGCVCFFSFCLVFSSLLILLRMLALQIVQPAMHAACSGNDITLPRLVAYGDSHSWVAPPPGEDRWEQSMRLCSTESFMRIAACRVVNLPNMLATSCVAGISLAEDQGLFVICSLCTLNAHAPGVPTHFP